MIVNDQGHDKTDAFHLFYQGISILSNKSDSIADFLKDLLGMMREYCSPDKIEIYLSDSQAPYYASIEGKSVIFEYDVQSRGYLIMLNRIYQNLVCQKSPQAESAPLPQAKFALGDVSYSLFRWVDERTLERIISEMNEYRSEISEGGKYGQIAMMPLSFGDEYIGQILFKNKNEKGSSFCDAQRYTELACFVAMSVSNYVTRKNLHERVKELTCLYKLNEISYNPGGPLEEVLHKVIKLLPPAFQYPSICSAMLIFDEDVYATSGYDDKFDSISRDIYVIEEKRGVLSVCYSEKKPKFHEGPFLIEERSLIDSFADELSILIERAIGRMEKEQMEDQLRHADRLATIGQLAAGIAHEINEPLSAILGFSQLILKEEKTSGRVLEDAKKIETASLYAREVIKKLLVFSRQTPLKKGPVKLNKVIEDGIFVLKARCEKTDIKVVLELEESLPEIYADASQMNQVLINLGVNALQAMPDGGILKIETKSDAKNVYLMVEDTGLGMTKKICEKAFMPFFTTKDVCEGTGLGLSVVHGIVKAHRGEIELSSQLGRGTRFAIAFPIDKNDTCEESTENEEIKTETAEDSGR